MNLSCKITEEVIARRRPAWTALASLFMDTEASLMLEWRAKTLADSPYSIEELEDILIAEVYPVCTWNFFHAAGDWVDFGPEWLEKEMTPRIGSKPSIFSLGRINMRLSPDWRQTKSEIMRLRHDRGADALPQVSIG